MTALAGCDATQPVMTERQEWAESRLGHKGRRAVVRRSSESILPMSLGVKSKKYLCPDHFALVVDANQFGFSVLVVLILHTV